MGHKFRYFDKQINHIYNDNWDYSKCEICGLYEATRIEHRYEKQYFTEFGVYTETWDIMPSCNNILMESVLE